MRTPFDQMLLDNQANGYVELALYNGAYRAPSFEWQRICKELLAENKFISFTTIDGLDVIVATGEIEAICYVPADYAKARAEAAMHKEIVGDT